MIDYDRIEEMQVEAIGIIETALSLDLDGLTEEQYRLHSVKLSASFNLLAIQRPQEPSPFPFPFGMQGEDPPHPDLEHAPAEEEAGAGAA